MRGAPEPVTIVDYDERWPDDFAAVAADLRAALVRAGYAPAPEITADHRPPGAKGGDAEWAKRFFRPSADQRPTNLHVRGAGRTNARYALLFRDYLRTHPDAVAADAETERRLVARPPGRVAGSGLPRRVPTPRPERAAGGYVGGPRRLPGQEDARLGLSPPPLHTVG